MSFFSGQVTHADRVSTWQRSGWFSASMWPFVVLCTARTAPRELPSAVWWERIASPWIWAVVLLGANVTLLKKSLHL